MAHRRKFEPDEELSAICTELWELDENKLEPGVDYELDLQGRVFSAKEIKGDRAKYPLFGYVNEDVFERPTYKAFHALLDNYESETGLPEVVTQEEIQENRDFIDTIMETPLMQKVHEVLRSRDKAPDNVMAFKKIMYDLWFKLYRRTRGDRDFDSCGFEHVFIGETRGRDVIGFHNWIQYYLQEKKGLIDYRGYFKWGTRSGTDEEHPRLVTIQFIWDKDQAKPVGSSFIGCSPEFEFGLYTMLFMLDNDGAEKYQLTIAEYDVEIHCFRLGKGIGTAYPQAK